MSVTKYKSTLFNISEERISHFAPRRKQEITQKTRRHLTDSGGDIKTQEILNFSLRAS
jgi:hypothetical protein